MLRILPLLIVIVVVATALPVGAQTQPLAAAAVPQIRRGVTPLAKRLPTAIGSRQLTGLATIQGNAMRSSGGLPNSTVRLRDARFGRIVDTQVSDKTGAFAFRGIDPGNYIVEIVGSNSQSAIAATQMITANAGETVTAVVRMPIQPSMFAGMLGQQSATTGAAGPAGITEIIPAIMEQLPQAAVQSIPAVVPVAPPVSSK